MSDSAYNRFDRAFHATAGRLLHTLDTAVQHAQLYDEDNKTLIETITRLTSELNRVFDAQPYFTFRGQDENIFVNEERLRCTGAAFLDHQKFLTRLADRKIGGIAFHTRLSSDEWRMAVSRIARADIQSPTPFEDVRESLQEVGLWEKMELLQHHGMVRLVSLHQTEEVRNTAVRVYSNCISYLRLYLENMGDAANLGYYHLKLYRSVQDLASLCRDGGWKYVGLVNNKNFDEYEYNHPVNVALLSLAVGTRLNLRRARLSELGLAAVLHDLGKVEMPNTFMQKPRKFTAEERNRLKEHPRRGVMSLLRARHYNEGLLKRIMVIHEHHEPLKEGKEYHPFSRIIGVAEIFDALTSHRPFREAYLPDEAIKKLILLAGTRLDSDVVSLFVQTLGLYPSGTLLELSTGEKAIVMEPSSDPEKWERPIVRIIRDPNGNEVDPPLIVDLSTGRDEEGSPRRQVFRTLHPEEIGINVSGYLYSSTDTDKDLVESEESGTS